MTKRWKVLHTVCKKLEQKERKDHFLLKSPCGVLHHGSSFTEKGAMRGRDSGGEEALGRLDS
jgi:hypothetical protein